MSDTRSVRGESGAIFEVDSSMIEEPVRDAGYRQSSAAPSVSTIVPAPPRPRIQWDRVVLAVALGMLAIALTLALLR